MMDFDKPQFLGGALGLPQHLQNLEPDTLEDAVEGAIDTIYKQLNTLLTIMDKPWPLGPTHKWVIYRECRDKVAEIKEAVDKMQCFLNEVR
jgi:hypothetical protein